MKLARIHMRIWFYLLIFFNIDNSCFSQELINLKIPNKFYINKSTPLISNDFGIYFIATKISDSSNVIFRWDNKKLKMMKSIGQFYIKFDSSNMNVQAIDSGIFIVPSVYKNKVLRNNLAIYITERKTIEIRSVAGWTFSESKFIKKKGKVYVILDSANIKKELFCLNSQFKLDKVLHPRNVKFATSNIINYSEFLVFQGESLKLYLFNPKDSTFIQYTLNFNEESYQYYFTSKLNQFVLNSNLYFFMTSNFNKNFYIGNIKGNSIGMRMKIWDEMNCLHPPQSNFTILNEKIFYLVNNCSEKSYLNFYDGNIVQNIELKYNYYFNEIANYRSSLYYLAFVNNSYSLARYKIL